MKKIFEKFRGHLVGLSKDVVGVVVGYTSSHFLLLLENGLEVNYSFSLDELGREDYYIDISFEEDCDSGLYCYADESHLIRK